MADRQPHDVITDAIETAARDNHYVLMASYPAVVRSIIAEHVLDALAGAGYTVVPTAEWDKLVETAAEFEGRFPRCLVVKPDRDTDFYIGWSENVEAPVWAGTRQETLDAGCPESRLKRADERGTSSMQGFYRWDSDGMVAEQRGFLPRANLAAYVTAYLAGRMDDCWDLLEPFEDGMEVRRS